MAGWGGKTRGGVSGYAIFVFLVSFLPLRAVYLVLNFVVLYFFFFSPNAFKSIFDFYYRRKKFGRVKSLRYVWRNYYLLGQSLIDKISLYSQSGHMFTFDFDGEEYLKEIARGGKGGFLVSAHVGNWDVAGSMLDRIDSKINVVMLDAEHQRIKNYLSGVFKSQKFNIIPIKDDFSHLLKIKEALQKNELICIHGDRFVPGAKTLRKIFLGYEASFPAGPFLLPAKFNVPVSFVFAMKERNDHYHFFASKPVQFNKPGSTRERENQSGLLLDQYIRNLEMILDKYPEQWFNYYNFWS